MELLYVAAVALAIIGVVVVVGRRILRSNAEAPASARANAAGEQARAHGHASMTARGDVGRGMGGM